MLDEGQREDWFSSRLIITAASIAFLCLVSVVLWELRQNNPVVDFRLLRERNFAISTASMFALGFVLYGTTAALPLFLQGLLGYTATQSGMVLSPGGIVIMLLMPLVGTLVSRVQPRWLIAFGLLMMGAGMYLMTHWNLQIAFSNAVKARVVQSVGMAFLFVPINAVAFNFIAKDRISYATGIINLARNIGGSTGIATVTTVLARRMQFHQSVLVANLTPTDPQYQAALQGTAGMLQQHGMNSSQAAKTAQGLIYGMVQQQSAMLAYLDIFYMMAIISVALIPLLMFMKNIQPHKGEIHVE
jgi:DHA2 family multidrug resistance protein